MQFEDLAEPDDGRVLQKFLWFKSQTAECSWSCRTQFHSVGPQFEDLAESGGGAGVDEEGTFVGAEVLPVSAAERRQTVDRNKALITLPPENPKQTHNNLQIHKVCTDNLWRYTPVDDTVQRVRAAVMGVGHNQELLFSDGEELPVHSAGHNNNGTVNVIRRLDPEAISDFFTKALLH